MGYLKPRKQEPDGTAHFRLPLPMLKKLDNYCTMHKISRSMVLRKLICNFEPLNAMPKDECPEPTTFGYPEWLVSNKS